MQLLVFKIFCSTSKRFYKQQKDLCKHFSGTAKRVTMTFFSGFWIEYIHKNVKKYLLRNMFKCYI